MNNLKLILVIEVFIILAITVPGFTQDNTQKDVTSQEVKTYKLPPEEQATKITNRLNKKLKLTNEQYEKIKKLFADNITYRRELKTKDIISKNEIKQRKKDFHDGIKNILTDGQQKKMEKMMKKRHKKHHTHHRHSF
jgi:hypothetical protein